MDTTRGAEAVAGGMIRPLPLPVYTLSPETMRDAEFDATGGMAVLGELARLTAAPAGLGEICDQGLSLMVKALGPARASLFLRRTSGSLLDAAATWGESCLPDLAPLAERALALLSPVETVDEGDRALRVALPLTGGDGPVGAIVLDRPRHWNPAARIFARSATRAIAAALGASRVIGGIRSQGEMLAKRNIELEALREFAGRIQVQEGGEREILEAALDLVLEKLGLEAGWIFWGEANRGTLELAASRGVAEEFVCEARERGIGDCLCKDVFRTGRRMEARNTTECPRLPHLVRGSGPIAHASIPLQFERGALGVMNIANRPGQVFTAAELQFMETLGNQVCMAIDRSRSARAESRRNAEARALAALTRAIGGSLEQDRVLAAVGSYGRELLTSDRCAIFLGDDPGRIRFAFLSGPPLAGIEVGGVVDLGALGSRALLGALNEKQPRIIADTARDIRASADLSRRWGIGSVIVVPLLAHDRLEGVLMAARPRPSMWSSEEVELAQTLAGHAALSIENARLYREAQEALARLQHAQYGMMRAERLAAVGTLAASLAHEVRNPLNSINLQLVLLSRRMAKAEPSLRAEITGLLDIARREIARLDGLVNEFLTLSSIDNLTLLDTDPGEIARDVLVLMSPLAQERGLGVAEDLEADLPRLPLDREKMKQVLINLARNAIEAMPGRGTLTVSCVREKGAVVYRVADTGQGIEPGLDIFNFFTTTKRDGTGLGLPIARRIVEAHGGTLGYESRPGRGTVFSITLRVPGRSAADGESRGRR